MDKRTLSEAEAGVVVQAAGKPLSEGWNLARIAETLMEIKELHETHLFIDTSPTGKQELGGLERVVKAAKAFRDAMNGLDDAAFDRLRRHYTPGNLFEGVSYSIDIAQSVADAGNQAAAELYKITNARDMPGMEANQATQTVRLPGLFTDAFQVRATFSGGGFEKTPAGRFVEAAWPLVSGQGVPLNHNTFMSALRRTRREG